MPGLEERTIDAFGREWTTFDYARPTDELERLFEEYFDGFPWHELPPDARGFDLGCGTGRWARIAARRVGSLTCVDASPAAVAVARRNLASVPNCRVLEGRAGELPLEDGSMDFGYALGVLHHLVDPPAALRDAVSKLKPGAPFLAYVYYALDGRPLHYRLAWRGSDAIRQVVSRLPYRARLAVARALAALVYYPLARLARLLEGAGAGVEHMPLAQYRNASFYVMKTDALDRFGVLVERRYTRAETVALLEDAGFERVRVSDTPPYWCVLGHAPAAKG